MPSSRASHTNGLSFDGPSISAHRSVRELACKFARCFSLEIFFWMPSDGCGHRRWSPHPLFHPARNSPALSTSEYSNTPIQSSFAAFTKSHSSSKSASVSPGNPTMNEVRKRNSRNGRPNALQQFQETPRRSTRASSAPAHSGWRAAAACPYIWLAADAPQSYPAIFASRDSDRRKEISPTVNHPSAPVSPAAARDRRAVQIFAVRSRILPDQRNFPRSRPRQILRLAHHGFKPPAAELPAQLGNNAKHARMIAAFRNLDIRRVLRRGHNRAASSRDTETPAAPPEARANRLPPLP